jgi:hypothetical protein
MKVSKDKDKLSKVSHDAMYSFEKPVRLVSAAAALNYLLLAHCERLLAGLLMFHLAKIWIPDSFNLLNRSEN